jgi:hypothetical protein
LTNGIKDLKTVKSRDPKSKKQTIATEKHVAAAISQIPLKPNEWLIAGTYQALLRQDMPWISATYPN